MKDYTNYNKCYVCKKYKPLECFCKDRTRSKGVQSKCKKCDNIRKSIRNKSPEYKMKRKLKKSWNKIKALEVKWWKFLKDSSWWGKQ